MFPKHTQLQNSTERIQIPPSTLSLVKKPRPMLVESGMREWGSMDALAAREEVADAGEGIMSGLEARRRAVPVAPTALERMKPGFERSIRYQSTGLTRARVRDACSVEAQGSLRCGFLARYA
jgi:hypothetical protein